MNLNQKASPKHLFIAALFGFGLWSCMSGEKAPSIDKPDPRAFPGIAAVDIYDNLTDKGFKMETRTGVNGLQVWKLDRRNPFIEQGVEVVGLGPSEIISLDARVMSTISLDETWLLPFLATLPCDGCQPEKAAQFVIKATKAGGNHREDIGPLSYSVFSMRGGKSFFLTIRKSDTHAPAP